MTELCSIVVPTGRRLGVIKLAHNSVHWAARKTKQRIILSGITWPTMASDVMNYCATCSTCQMRARQMRTDKVPISIVEKARQGQVFQHMHCDVFGPILPNQNVRYNYALIVIDSMSRYPFACPLRSLHAKNICDALLSVFEITGVCSSMVLTMDNASYFRSALTKAFLKRIGVSPLFSTEYHPEGNAIAERNLASINGTTHVPPHLLVFGSLPRGPLAILRETWLGQRESADSSSKVDTSAYLEGVLDRLQTAQKYAADHAEIEQARHVRHYNLKSKDKQFAVGDKCLILQRDSTASSVFSRWKGPATVVQVCSPYTYMIELNGGRYHMHANNLRKFNVRVDEVECKSISCDISSDSLILGEGVVNNCTIIYDNDVDFGNIAVVETFHCIGEEMLPSQRISPDKIAHLSLSQRDELLKLLDRYATVFSDKPGLCTLVQHEVTLLPGFAPKRLRAYRVPQSYKAEVDRQVSELLRLGFIEPSTSPQASPIVVVLKQPDAEGNRKLRLAVD